MNKVRLGLVIFILLAVVTAAINFLYFYLKQGACLNAAKCEMDLYEIVTILIQLLILFAAIWAVITNRKLIKLQDEQWSNEVLIRYEKETLIELKKKVFDCSQSFSFWHRQYFLPTTFGYQRGKKGQDEIYEKRKKEGYSIDRSLVVKHYNKMSDLNRYLAANQSVFLKYGLYEAMANFSFVFRLLIVIYANPNLSFVLTEDTGTSLRYEREDWKNSIIGFVFGYRFEFKGEMPNESSNVELQNKSFVDFEKEFNEYIEELFQRIQGMSDILDQATTYGAQESDKRVGFAGFPLIED